MSKYFYIKSENKIYEPNEMNIGLVIVHNDKHKQIYKGKPEWEELFSVGDHFYSDYVAFDSFEDLIEVGDLVKKYNDEDDFEYIMPVWNIEEFRRGRHEVRAIYKSVGKDFIRVCYKENGKWVLD